MSSGSGNFSEKERISAENFRKALENFSKASRFPHWNYQ
jgi:hypothetical protein